MLLKEILPLWATSKKNKWTNSIYFKTVTRLFKKYSINTEQSLEEFADTNFNQIIISLKNSGGNVNTINLNIHSLKSLLNWLYLYTDNKKFRLKKNSLTEALPKRSNKVLTKTFPQAKILAFIQEVTEYKPIFGLIARLCYGGAKRIGEVLELKGDDIDFKNNCVTFRQFKRPDEFYTVITYDKKTMNMLKFFKRDGYIFVGERGKRITGARVNNVFRYVSNDIHTHVLRTSAITTWRDCGIAFEDIIKASGHATMNQLLQYDKSDPLKNPSLTHNLLG